MENDVMLNDGTQVPAFEPAYGGELMPVDQAYGSSCQPSKTEMALSIGVCAGAGILTWELGKLFWKKVLVPGYIKAMDKVDEWNAQKDEKMARRRAKKKNRDIVEGNFKNANEENGVDPDEDQDEQPLDKKGVNQKAIAGMRKNRRR